MSSESESTNEYVASDPDEYSRLQRLKAIHGARKDVVETQRRADNAMIVGEISQEIANAALRRSVEMYILELEPLLKADEVTEKTDLECDYWKDVQLGTVELPNGGDWQLIGLKSLIEAPEVKRIEWEDVTESKETGREPVPKSEEIVVPRHILIRAYRFANQFLSDVGLDIEFKKDETKTYGFQGEVVKVDDE